MYLVRSDDTPSTSAKAHGLLLLAADDVAYLTGAPAPTLSGFLERGDEALLARPLALDMPLQPFAQLR
jgi:hypothetical protein